MLDPSSPKSVLGEDITVVGSGHTDIAVAAGLVYDRALTDQERPQVEAGHRGKYSSSDSGRG
jgi:hypothetical protein